MAGPDWREQARAQMARTAKWMEQRNADAQQGGEALLGKARQLYGDATRAGLDLQARTPMEVRRLAIAAATGQLPAAVADLTVQKSQPLVRAAVDEGARMARDPAERQRVFADAKQQARAGASGAVDEASFGLADPTLAAVDALHDGGLQGFRNRYDANMRTKAQEDAYDERRYGLARGAGEAAGFALSLAGTGGVGAGEIAGRVAPKALKAMRAVREAQRIRELTPGGLNTIAAVGGGVSGLAGQGVSDMVTGHLSSPADYGAAAIGAGLGTLSMRARVPGSGRAVDLVNRFVRSPMTSGAIDGGVTEALQEVADGRPLSIRNVAEAGRGGAVAARGGDLVGAYGSNALPWRAKGPVGDQLSAVKSIASGDGLPFKWATPIPEFDELLPGTTWGQPGPQRYIRLSQGGTRADHITHKAVAVEAKFGRGPELRKRQLQAETELPPDRYRIDHWIPNDVGRIAGTALAPAGGHWINWIGGGDDATDAADDQGPA